MRFPVVVHAIVFCVVVVCVMSPRLMWGLRKEKEILPGAAQLRRLVLLRSSNVSQRIDLVGHISFLAVWQFSSATVS